jgi:hypothetical protein
MIAQGANKFAAQDCPINTYGAAGIVYGWAAAPCKPCARNMITDGAVKVNNSDVCVNDDGFGYASEGECSRSIMHLQQWVVLLLLLLPGCCIALRATCVLLATKLASYTPQHTTPITGRSCCAVLRMCSGVAASY